MQFLYKYRLHELFIANYGANRLQAKKIFAAKYGHSLSSVELDCSKIITSSPIRKSRLEQYADFFSVDVEELKTKKVAA